MVTEYKLLHILQPSQITFMFCVKLTLVWNITAWRFWNI